MPSDNNTDLGGNQVTGLDQHKDGHLCIYSSVLLYLGLNTYFLSETRFELRGIST